MSNTTRWRGLRVPILAVLLIAIMLMSTAAIAAPGATHVADQDEHDFFEDGLEEADEVYIDEDGDAVLVYHDDDADVDELYMGGHVAEGLLYMFVMDEHDQAELDEFEDAEMTASALLEGDVFELISDASIEQPPEVEHVDISATGEITHSVNDVAIGVEAEFIDDGHAPFVGDVSSEGELTVAYDSFVLDSETQAVFDMEPAPDTEVLSIEIEDLRDGYAATVHQSEPVHEFNAEQWDSEENATLTLEMMYAGIAEELGGDGVVEVHSHDFTERDDGTYWLDIQFTVELVGVEDGLAEMIATELMNDPASDVTEEQARAVGEAVTEIDIESFAVHYENDRASLSVATDIHIDGIDDLAFAVIDVAEEQLEDADELQEFSDDGVDDFEDFKEFYEAQAAADVSHHLDWDVSLVGEAEPEHVVVRTDSVVHYYVENWDAYNDELGEDGFAENERIAFDVAAESTGDAIDVTADLTVEKEGLVDDVVDMWIASLREESDDASTDAFISALGDAEVEVAKFDFDLNDERVELEAGAQLDNAEAFFDDVEVVPDEFVAQDTNSSTMYVHVTDAVESDPSESDVERLNVVGEDTEVHMPGEWEEEFPRFDVEGAADYLGVELTAEDDDEDVEDDSIPGFGVAAALIALFTAGGVGWYARRRH